MRYENNDTLRYYIWLLDIVRFDLHERNKYGKLLRFLHDTTFFWFMNGDSNRAKDGLLLRDKFAEVYQVDRKKWDILMDSRCSLLEMLVSLALRFDDDFMYDPNYGDRTSRWFWIMIDNLGLSDMTDESFDFDKVNQIINDFMMRRYKENGRGSLFPIRGCSVDMRDYEIWYQMNFYINSNINKLHGQIV